MPDAERQFILAAKQNSIRTALERLNPEWSVKFDGDHNITFSGHSKAGEDLSYELEYDDLDDIPDLLFDIYEDFCVDDHVFELLSAKKRGKADVPDAETLVADAKWIDAFLDRLHYAVRIALKGTYQPA